MEYNCWKAICSTQIILRNLLISHVILRSYIKAIWMACDHFKNSFSDTFGAEGLTECSCLQLPVFLLEGIVIHFVLFKLLLTAIQKKLPEIHSGVGLIRHGHF